MLRNSDNCVIILEIMELKHVHGRLFYCLCAIITTLMMIFATGKTYTENSNGELPVLKFGHATGENPAIIFGKYSKLIRYLSKKLDRKIVFVQRKGYEDTQKAFLGGEIDMGILNAFSYIHVSGSGKIVPIAARVKRNSRTYQTYIIVRKDGTIKSYEDLKGKIFAFGDPFSTSSNLMPRLLLRQHGIDPERDFKKVLSIKKQDSIIFAILNRTVDAGAIASFIFNEYDPEVTRRLRIMDRSARFPLGPFVVRKALDPLLRKKIQAILLDMDKSKVGLEALHHAELDRFEMVSDNDYNIVRDMYRRAMLFKQSDNR